MKRAKVAVACKDKEIVRLVVEWNGHKFLVVAGEHIHGWFIAIPNMGICIESSWPEDEQYNAVKLAQAMGDFEKGSVIASAIKEAWEVVNED